MHSNDSLIPTELLEIYIFFYISISLVNNIIITMSEKIITGVISMALDFFLNLKERGN